MADIAPRAGEPGLASTPGTGREPRAERPGMEGYGIEQTAEGLLPWPWADEQLAAAHNYWVATTRPDGRPHVAPVWGVWLDGAYYFSTGATSRKARNLAANSHIVVHLESGDDTVVVEGRAESGAGLDESYFRKVADSYEAKYEGVRPEQADTWVVRPIVVFGWREKDYPKSATRWRFDRR